jgi:hypothetical protein
MAADHGVPSKSTHALRSESSDLTDKEPREDHGEQPRSDHAGTSGEASTRAVPRAARPIIAWHGLRMTLIALRHGHQLAQRHSPGLTGGDHIDVRYEGSEAAPT